MTHDVRSAARSDGLADVLERILDKGIVIAGDVSVALVGIELLTIRLRLLIATVDRAKEMGIDWWERDPRLSARSDRDFGSETEAERLQHENAALRERIEALERLLPAAEGVSPRRNSVVPA